MRKSLRITLRRTPGKRCNTYGTTRDRAQPGSQVLQTYSREGETMKTIIYYFTGTGNSLAVAKKICGSLGDCELVPVVSMAGTQGEVIPPADRVGIVCPVYFLGLPTIVARFAEKLDLSRSGYTFAVVTLGGSGGASALRQLDGILKERSGRGLDVGFMVQMPGNYILMYSSPAGTSALGLESLEFQPCCMF